MHLIGLKELAVNRMGKQTVAGASARRRLLRGALAVPSVMTLTSGSALAATSSLACAGRLPDGVVVGAEDNYFRVQRYTLTISADTRLLVNGADITSRATIHGFSASTYVAAKTWILVSDGSDQTGWVGTNSPGAETGKFVALRFTNTGTATAPVFNVTGLSDDATPNSGSGRVMSESCWSSFT